MTVSTFAQGQQDCREGKEASSLDDDYLAGYSFEYTLEQVNTYFSEKREEKNVDFKNSI